MSGEKPATKLCKHCKTEIPYAAKVCPNCRKKQGGVIKWIAIGVLIVFVIAAAAGGNSKSRGTDSNPKKAGDDTAVATSTNAADTATQTAAAEVAAETAAETEDEGANAAETEEQTVFYVGDTVETSALHITFVSAEQYTSDNQFLQPKDGYVYYRLTFEFENISDSDQVVAYWDFDGYADGYAIDQAYFDDIFSATLSAGKKASGVVYFEVPTNCQIATAEYETNFWTSNRVEFQFLPATN